MNTKDWQGVWVIAEQVEGKINNSSFELLGKAQELKTGLKTTEPVTAVLLGENISELAPELARYGAERIIVAEHPALKIYQNEAYALVLEDIILHNKPSIVLVGATGIGSDLAPVIGARLKTGVAAHCVDVRTNDSGDLVAVVPAFGGKVLGDILCPNHRPQVATLKPGVLDKKPACEKPVYTVIHHDPAGALARDSGRVKAIRVYREEYTGIPLEEAEVVVAGGWGIGSTENWSLIKELAALLGGAVGATRPAVDEGWAEGEHQMIGTSGKTVRPKVYIGAGISGATHHLCGMKDSGLVISINKDKEAPIFECSDLRVVGDARTIMSSLIAQIKEIHT